MQTDNLPSAPSRQRAVWSWMVAVLHPGKPPNPVRQVFRFWSWIAVLGLRVVRWLAVRMPDPKRPFRIPLVGAINGRMWARPVDITSEGLRSVKLEDPFIPSMTVPSILQIRVNGSKERCRPKLLSEPVATDLFGRFDEFRVNVAFSCGKAQPLQPGVYGDPESPWFNVFVGYYQVDVLKETWKRPFGYRGSDETGFEIHPEEIALLGRADWDYFSNYLYGVPLDSLQQNAGRVHFDALPTRQRIGSEYWDHLLGTEILVASAYQSTVGVQLTHRWFNQLWRAAFGQPGRRDHPEASFPTTELKAELYAAWQYDPLDLGYRAPVYRTFIFGGTVNRSWEQGDNDRARQNQKFLELQMDTIKTLIKDYFRGVGFAVPDRPTKPNFSQRGTTG